MLNKLTAFIRAQGMIKPGEQVICAVSGGADSVALLFGLYLLKEKLDFRLSAAHFNHRLRGAESDRDEAFVKDFCARYDIPLHLGSGEVAAGAKGLEAAARDARYAFLRNLPGKLATAHTADDNAETVLLHLIRGTGLKGLCGITPAGEGLIRPLLTVTRREVEAFLAEYCLPHVEDSSNLGDDFQRNRLRHHVMPLLTAENPRLAENMTAMALSLQTEEALLEQLAEREYTGQVSALREMAPGLRSRILTRILQNNGLQEPSRSHISLLESLVFSEKPSAQARFPDGLTMERCYDTLRPLPTAGIPRPQTIQVGQEVIWGGWRVRCQAAGEIIHNPYTFTLAVSGQMQLRSRLPGDAICLPGGTKPLKKLFIDRKIPASQRPFVPVLADAQGVLGVAGIGPDGNHIANELPAVQFIFEKTDTVGGF